MKKRNIVVIIAIVSVAASIGTVGLFLPWRTIVAKLPFIEKSQEKAVVEEVADHQPVGEGTPSAGHENARAEAEGDEVEHTTPPKKADDEKVELIPAADFVLPTTRNSSVVKAMREITLLQTEMAVGTVDAPQKLKLAMLKVPKLIAEIDPSKATSSEVQAIALYVLSGGEPSVILKLLKAETLSKEQRELLEGVFSYSTADTGKAVDKLTPIDAKQFDVILNAQLTIAHAQLATAANRSNSIRQLAYAADIVPGTLIEEAAIRRIVARMNHKSNVDQFFYWSGRYLRRFPRSLYYHDFESSFVAAVMDMPGENANELEAGLTGLFKIAGEVRSEDLSRQILLSAISNGKMETCSQIFKSISPSYSLDSRNFENVSALMRVCVAANGDPDNLKALRAIKVSNLEAAIARHVAHAVVMEETIQSQEPLQDDGSFGPHQPLSTDQVYTELFASVAQQLAASTVATNRIINDETGSGRQH